MKKKTNQAEALRRWKLVAKKRAEMLMTLRGECRALADLSADTPQFTNPLHVAEARRIRDRWLKS